MSENKPSLTSYAKVPSVDWGTSIFKDFNKERFRAHHLRQLLADPRVDFDHPDIISLLHSNLDNYIEKEGGLHANSWRRITSSWKQFVTYCEVNDLAAIPAHPKTVEEYLKHRAVSVSRSTLDIDFWSLNTFHLAAGAPDFALDKEIEIVRRSINLQKLDEDKNIEPATPLHKDKLAIIKDRLLQNAKLIDLRDAAMLDISYACLLRQSELTGIKVEHIKERYGTWHLEIPKSKQNKSGRSQFTSLPPSTVKLITSYMKEADIEGKRGYLFTGITKYGKIAAGRRQMSYPTVNRVYKKVFDYVADRYQLGEKSYSSHSCRVGGAEDLLREGRDLAYVMKRGRWKTARMAMEYGRFWLDETPFE